MRTLNSTRPLVTMCAIVCFGVTTARAGQPFEFVTQQVFALGAQPGDWFGYSVALGSGYLATSSIHHDSGGVDAGAVYVFDAGNGSLLYTLVATDSQPGDRFGYDLDIHENLLVVSAPYDNVDGIEGVGSLYLYNLYTGELITKFVASDRGFADQLGWSVAITEGAVVGGAVGWTRSNGVVTGAAYAFSTDFLNQLVRFNPADGTSEAFFGGSMDVDTTYLAVGASRMNNGIGESGAVYIYSYFNGDLLHKLVPNDPIVGQGFGSDVAILGDRIYVGAPFDQDRGFNAGAVYVFDALSGAQLTKILPPTFGQDVWFGRSVAADDNDLLVGAMFDNQQAADAGAVYFYNAETYTLVDKVVLSDAVANDQFGFDVGAGDRQYAAGAYRRDTAGVDSGGAYLIHLNCFPDLNNDSLVDFFDVSTLINVQVDYNGDGVFNFFDVSAFLSDYQIGCP